MSQAPERRQGCLLIGCPRSGTFLLMAILEQCFDMATPVETHFIPGFDRYKWLWGDLRKAQNRRRLLDAIYDFIDIWTPRMIVSGEMDLAWTYSLAATRPQAERILAHSTDYPDLVQTMMDVYCEIHGKSAWIEKSAFFRHVDMGFVDRVLPETKVIHILRDGRDCSLSWMATWATPASLEEAALLWDEHVREKSDWVRRHPDRSLELRYEDLTADPDAKLAKIAAFLGRPAADRDTDLSESEYARVLSQLSSHRMVAGKIQAGNAQKYISKMTEGDRAAFFGIAGETLERFGYEPEPHVAPPGSLRRAWIRVHGAVTQNAFRRGVKAHLPLLIFVAQRLGINLPSLVNRMGTAREWPNRRTT